MSKGSLVGALRVEFCRPRARLEENECIRTSRSNDYIEFFHVLFYTRLNHDDIAALESWRGHAMIF